MTKKQIQAVQAMWDALAQIVEDPDSGVIPPFKRDAINALKKAQAAFPDEA